MKRQFVSSICVALLVWATIDDALAAQTPELDDDVAAALDNDCLQSASVKVPTRAEALPLYLSPREAAALLACSPASANSRSVGGSHPLSDPLYQFMSLQC
jgi:hypothetical protein